MACGKRKVIFKEGKEVSLRIMSVSKESPLTIIPEEVKKAYVPPKAKSLPTERIDRATSCACKAGDDNPY